MDNKASGDRPITYGELKKHAHYADAWISINGVVYDITNFIELHPCGDTFRGHLGTECGGLFSSAHALTNVESLIQNDSFLEKNKIRRIGLIDLASDDLHKFSEDQYLDRVIYKQTDRDDFWIDLKAKVAAYLKENGLAMHYSFSEGLAFIVYYFVIYLVLAYFTWVEASLIAPILLGIHMICANAHVAHMATHHGFTRSNALNAVAKHFFDLSGISSLEWQITHDTHHNQPHSSIDHQTNLYGYIGTRLHGFEAHKGYHRYQSLYFWLTVSPYLMFKFFTTTYWLFVNRNNIRHTYEIVGHALTRIVVLSQVALCAYLHDIWTAMLMAGLYSVAFSQTAFILLFNDHEDTHKAFEASADISCYQRKMSWAEIQVRTSNNWYPTNWLMRFIQFHYGYFNFHIEHHLFPTYNARLLKKISPIVREVCEAHNVPYISTTFMEVQLSLLQHLKALSVAPGEYPRGERQTDG